MTEVPEHLLQRSRDRRAALGLGGGDSGETGGGEAAAATSSSSSSSSQVQAATPTAAARPAAVSPAEVTIEPATPRPAYVQASLNRKKIPLWVMPVLAVLPLWAIVYVNTLSKPRSTVLSQLDAGTAVYAQCQSCHQADGSGGAGRPLYAAADGGVVATFPNIAGQLQFVWLGTALTANPVGSKGTPYGDPNRSGGQHTTYSYNGIGAMPMFKGSLTQTQLLEVVRHERETFGGEKVPAKQIAPDGSLLWPNGKPMLDATGTLVGPDGKALFNADGKLNDPTLATPAAGGTEQAAGS